jgi:hypothetical protein
VAFIVFMAGVFLVIKRRNSLPGGILLISFLVLFFYAVKTGDIFPTHNYYIIPFVPVMALIAGYALDALPWPRLAYLVLVVVAIESIGNQHVDFHPNTGEMYKLELEDLADMVSVKDDLIAITGGNNPQELYFAHRKGWILDKREFLDDAYISLLKERGCRYLFVNRNVLDQPLPYPVVHKDTHYIVYKP